MTSDNHCFVHIVLPGTTRFVPAGRFHLTETRSGVPLGRFVYGRSYLTRSDAVELDPVQLRLSERICETERLRGFFGAIRDAMPDDWGRRVIERRFGGGRLPEFRYLMEGPDDRAGALGFHAAATPPELAGPFPGVVHLAELQAAADAVAAGDPPPSGTAGKEAANLLWQGTSMGGARPKAVVEREGELWLAKFGRKDDQWNEARVEHGLLRLAGECGIRVADSRVETVGGRDALLVRRFDRRRADRGFYRHRVISAMTLLRADSSEAGRKRWSYLLFADEIRRASAASRTDLRELFMRMCFNASVSNYDDHPRNHALLAEGRAWRLSPAYDIMPMPTNAPGQQFLCMACGPFGRLTNRANLIAGASRFLLGNHEAEQLFQHVSTTVRARWEKILRRCGVSERDRRRVAPSFLHEGMFQELDLPARTPQMKLTTPTRNPPEEPFSS